MNRIRQKTDSCLAACLLGLLTGTPWAAPAQQSHASIRDAAHAHAIDATGHLPGRAEVTVGSLDSRLRLAACDQPLQTYDSPNGLNGGRGVVGVRCAGGKPWKLYVPVRVALYERVVVSRRPLVSGQTVAAGDVALAEIDVSGVHKAYFTQIDDVVGLRSKRAVAGGKTLHAGLLRREKLVKRGARVEIIANMGGLHVTMRGKALADGGRGDRIRVKNLNSGRVVSGTVSGRGVIQVLD